MEREWLPDNELNSGHFQYVTVGQVPSYKMMDVAEKLEERYKRLKANQGLQEIPLITIKVWGDRAAFEASFLEHQEGNAKMVGGYVVADNWEARFFNFDRPIGLTAVHEVTHLVSIAANKTINNNPRWLWEAIAIYESQRPPVPQKTELKCIGTEGGTTLQELNDHPFNIYRVGFYLTEYIIEEWGIESIPLLIKNNGNIQKVLGLSEHEFENMWHAWMVADLSQLDKAQPDC